MNRIESNQIKLNVIRNPVPKRSGIFVLIKIPVGRQAVRCRLSHRLRRLLCFQAKAGSEGSAARLFSKKACGVRRETRCGYGLGFRKTAGSRSPGETNAGHRVGDERACRLTRNTLQYMVYLVMKKTCTAWNLYQKLQLLFHGKILHLNKIQFHEKSTVGTFSALCEN